jgi:hypothetical protein
MAHEGFKVDNSSARCGSLDSSDSEDESALQEAEMAPSSCDRERTLLMESIASRIRLFGGPVFEPRSELNSLDSSELDSKPFRNHSSLVR